MGLLDDVLGKAKETVGASGAEQSNLANEVLGLLPTLIDRLTPDGKIPDSGRLQQGLEFLRNNLPRS